MSDPTMCEWCQKQVHIMTLGESLVFDQPHLRLCAPCTLVHLIAAAKKVLAQTEAQLLSLEKTLSLISTEEEREKP